MLNIRKNASGTGAVITGISLTEPLSDENFSRIFSALGEHSVLCFPGQSLTPENLRDFSAHFGYLQKGFVKNGPYEPDVPEVSILSNIVKDGRPIGLGDAGQDWHTDMSYNKTVGFTNVLHAIEVPRRDGKVLGNTLFANMYAAYDDLSPELKERLEGLTATHDFNKFWEEMRRRPGSTRAPLSPEERAKRHQRSTASFSITPSRAAGCCIATRGTPSESTSFPRPKATGCLKNSSNIS